MFSSLATAGMPFVLLVGAAPNAIAYDSEQFTRGKFLMYGIPPGLILMAVLVLMCFVTRPRVGMPVLIK